MHSISNSDHSWANSSQSQQLPYTSIQFNSIQFTVYFSSKSDSIFLKSEVVCILTLGILRDDLIINIYFIFRKIPGMSLTDNIASY